MNADSTTIAVRNRQVPVLGVGILAGIIASAILVSLDTSRSFLALALVYGATSFVERERLRCEICLGTRTDSGSACRAVPWRAARDRVFRPAPSTRRYHQSTSRSPKSIFQPSL